MADCQLKHYAVSEQVNGKNSVISHLYTKIAHLMHQEPQLQLENAPMCQQNSFPTVVQCCMNEAPQTWQLTALKDIFLPPAVCINYFTTITITITTETRL